MYGPGDRRHTEEDEEEDETAELDEEMGAQEDHNTQEDADCVGSHLVVLNGERV